MTFWRLLSCCCIFCENRSLLYQTGFALSMNPVDGELSEKTTNVTEWAKCLTICAALCSARGGKSRRCLSAGGHACMTTIEYLQQPGMPCRKFNRRYRENVLRFLHTAIGMWGGNQWQGQWASGIRTERSMMHFCCHFAGRTSHEDICDYSMPEFRREAVCHIGQHSGAGLSGCGSDIEGRGQHGRVRGALETGERLPARR